MKNPRTTRSQARTPSPSRPPPEPGDADPHATGEADTRYRAPALEKGLDILELLAAARDAMTVAEIARQLDRSKGELFRMVQVLEHRGYLVRNEASDGYRVTDRLFALGMSQPQAKELVDLALSVMRDLSQNCGQSCHLALYSSGQIVVVARMESSEEIGFAVRVGYRKSLLATVSGAILYAHQDEPTRQRWMHQLQPATQDEELEAFNRLVQKARRQGYLVAPSNFVAGVTDLSAPVMRGAVACAALTIPFVKFTDPRTDLDGCLQRLRAAAAQLSAQLMASEGHA